MSVDLWVVYDIASGEILYKGGGSPSVFEETREKLPEGSGVKRVPLSVITVEGVDLDKVKELVYLSIDQAAGQYRMNFITDVPGQMETYARKEANARAYLAGDTTATEWLEEEAELLGLTVHDLAEQVVTQADIWIPIARKIEAHRRGMKKLASEATNFGQAIKYCDVDWAQLLALSTETPAE